MTLLRPVFCIALAWLVVFQGMIAALAGTAVVRTPGGQVVIVCSLNARLLALPSSAQPAGEREAPVPVGDLCPAYLLAGTLSSAIPIAPLLLPVPYPGIDDAHCPDATSGPLGVACRGGPIRAPPAGA